MRFRKCARFVLIASCFLSIASAHSQTKYRGAGLFSIKRDGTGLKQLVGGLNYIVKGRFSPDGSKLIISTGFWQKPPGVCPGANAGGAGRFNTGKLFLAKADGADPQEIHGYTSATEPAFTPDGQKILFTSLGQGACNGPGKVQGIYSINLDGTGSQLIVPGAEHVYINSDSSKIAYTRSTERSIDTYLANVDGSDPKLLHSRSYFGRSDPLILAGFNPLDPSEVIFCGFGISTMNLHTLERHTVLGSLPSGTFEATYSPDAKTVLYLSAPPGEHQTAIYEIGVDGTGLRELYSGSADAPEYSPDGQTILFVGD